MIAAAPALAAPRVATVRRDVVAEARNRSLVLRFCEAVYNQRAWAVAERMLTADFIQHNPKIATGRRAFISSYAGVVARHRGLHSQVLRSATAGDLVWTHVRVTDTDGYDVALVNIFRVAGGRIAEHWDVLQPVPADLPAGVTMF